MATDNKMWEGHRMLLPQARDKFVQGKQQTFARPVWDEQRLEELERQLAEARQAGIWIKVILWSPQGPQEREVVFIQPVGSRLKCRDKTGRFCYIPFADILEITPLPFTFSAP